MNGQRRKVDPASRPKRAAEEPIEGALSPDELEAAVAAMSGSAEYEEESPHAPQRSAQTYRAPAHLDHMATVIPITEIPSEGIYYPEDTTIRIRPLKLPEAKKLSTVTEDNYEAVANDLLRNCMTGIAVDQLCDADRFYLLLWIRATTFPEEEFRVETMCSICNQPTTFHFDVNKLVINHVPETFTGIFTTPFSGDTIEWRHSVVLDKTLIDRFMHTNARRIKDLDTERVTLSHLILSINGNSNLSIIEKYHWLGNQEIRDLLPFQQHMEANDFGVSPVIPITCEACGGEAISFIRFHRSFFAPQYTNRGDTRS